MSVDLRDRQDEDFDEGKPAWLNNIAKEDDELENNFNAPDANDADLPPNHPDRSDRKGFTPQALAAKETDEDTGSGSTENNSEKKEKNRVAGAAGRWKTNITKKADESQAKRFSRKKKIAVFLGSGTSFLFLIVIALFFLANSLKVQHLAENISTWQFARTARLARTSASRVHATKIKIDISENSRYNALKSRYDGLRNRTWGRLDQFRPNKVVENLHTNEILDYKYSPPSATGRVKLQALIINGEEIPVAQKRRFNPLFNSAERARFSADVERALGDSIKDKKSLVRSKVLKNIREKAGVKLRWYDNFGDDYRGLPTEEADQKLLKESKEKISGEPRKDSSIPGVNDATDAADDAVDNCIDDPDCSKKIRNSKGSVVDVPEVGNTIDDTLDSRKLAAATSVLSTVSTAYAIATPVCIIYEGSISNSEDLIEQQDNSAIATYYSVASADHQERAGDASAEAVGAMDRKLGNIASSQAVLQSSGIEQEPGVISSQATAIGEFTVFNAILGVDNTVADLANEIVGTTCPALLDWRTATALAVGEFGFTIAGCITTGCSTKAGTEAIKLGVRQAIGVTARKMVSKRALTRIAGETAATASAALIAKMLVLGQMNAQYNGLASDENYADQALVGGTVTAEETNRKQSYGVPLPRSDYVVSAAEDARFIAETESNKSAYERYIATSNPNSLLSKTAVSTAAFVNSSTPLQSIGRAFNTWISQLGQLFNRTFGFQTAFAQSSDQVINAGVVAWDWTADEQARIDSDDSYEMLENQKILEDSEKEDEINSKYKNCYEDSMGKLLAEGDIKRDSNGNVFADKGKCSKKNLSYNNEDYGDLVFRWRLKNSLNNTLELLEGIADPSPSTGDGGGSTGPSEPTGLPTGTVNEGDTVVTNKGNIRVHTSIIDNVNKLIDAAEKDGLTLTGGGWRSPDKQIELRKAHCGTSHFDIYEKSPSSCRPPTARPGSSNHEKGLAIDFRCNGNSMGSRSSPCFVWLAANAATYGLKNLPSEPWHWSVNGK